MVKLERILELMRALIISTADNTIKINKTTIAKIKKCLQNSQEKIDFLQLESQLQQEELKHRSHHSELVSV